MTVECSMGENQYFEVNPKINREPVQSCQDGGDVTGFFGPGEQSGGGVLDELEFIDRCSVEAGEQRVAIVQSRGDESVYGHFEFGM